MRDRLLEFELELDKRSNEQVVEYDWGRAFLSPGLPLAWDANWALIERPRMTGKEVVAAADECLADYAHRAIAIKDETEDAGIRGLRRSARPAKGPDSGDKRLRRSFVRGYKGAIWPSLLGSVMLFSRDQDFKSIALGIRARA